MERRLSVGCLGQTPSAKINFLHYPTCQAVATHEIGHLLGLAESPFGSALRSTPSPTLTSMRMLNDDDIAGITFLYPRHVLKGVVRDALSGSPLSDASIKKVGIYWTVKTNSEGHYEYGMPSGIAYILAYCDGYMASLEAVEVTEDSVTVYDISLSPIPPEGPITSVEDVLSSGIPGEYLLAQNFPNPFNSTTTIKYQLPQAGQVRLSIYNSLGQEIRRLVDKHQSAGYYSVVWDGKDGSRAAAASGLYFYRLNAGNFVDTKKVLLLH